jgi:hypothetical protein
VLFIAMIFVCERFHLSVAFVWLYAFFFLLLFMARKTVQRFFSFADDAV